ncbi:MAG TPA: NUDIX domain-containing protein [Bryobacteraceae bacterium]|nr:NUDIX domain-containing protein [Bryobacteraceae bacterium]
MASVRISAYQQYVPYNPGRVLKAADVIRLLERFHPGRDGEALKSRDLTLALLAWSPNPFSRKIYTPGHVTCTGVVLSPKRKRVLVVHHNRLDRWLLPGGHCERSDPSIASVAQREVIEETGAILTDRDAPLVGVDVHPIPANHKEPMHLHHDLIFAFHAKSTKTECSLESRAVTWCDRTEYDAYDLPGPIRKAVERALDHIR